MISYIIRRILYAVPILIGVNVITFLLFFVVNSPDDMAISQLGQKYTTEQQIEDWKRERGYHLPLFHNADSRGLHQFKDTIFYQKSVRLFVFDFGSSDSGRDISYDIKQRMWPSLAIAVPNLIIGLMVTLSFALLIADTGLEAIKFLVLPVIIGVISGIGASTRWYRTIFLEEMSKDYVRTARAKGLSETHVMFGHVLRNAMIPILTGIVVVLPLLFMGSLLTENFFGIPGLGSYTIDAINRQDFAIVRSMVYLGSVLYIIGLLLTDISYTLVDPRIRLR